MSRRQIESARDANGQEIFKGDTVATMSDNTSARVADLCEDMDMEFVRIKPLHQPYGKGVWHAADSVIRVSGITRKKFEEKKAEEAAKAKEKAAEQAEAIADEKADAAAVAPKKTAKKSKKKTATKAKKKATKKKAGKKAARKS